MIPSPSTCLRSRSTGPAPSTGVTSPSGTSPHTRMEPRWTLSGYPHDLTDIRIETQPGTGFEYSGLSTHILELAVESATGLDFDTLMTRRVFRPLDLASTGYIYGDDDPAGPVLPGLARFVCILRTWPPRRLWHFLHGARIE